MGAIEPPLDRKETLADIQTLVRVALLCDDIIAVQRDLAMILTIVEMVLPPRDGSGPSLEGVIYVE